MRRTRRRRLDSGSVSVRVPLEQTPLFHIPGPRGGWFVSLLWGFGENVIVSWNYVSELLAMRDGSIVLGRRLTASEAQELDVSRADCDHELHARIVNSENVRWRSRIRPRRGDSNR